MEKKNLFSQSLAVIGTIFTWLPIAAPFFFGFMRLSADGIFRFDYLMPAEFAFLVFAGAVLLLWAAIRSRKRVAVISSGLGIAAISIVISLLVGDVQPGTWEHVLVICLLGAYTLAAVLIGIGGILLWRDLFHR